MKLTRENFATHSEFIIYQSGYEHGAGEKDKDYANFVLSVFKTFPRDIESFLHAGVGISGEAGEILDALKKTWVYGKELDRENLKEELGDILFYIVALTEMLGTTLGEIQLGNIAKLEKRYPFGYSDTAAQARADKLEEHTRTGSPDR